MRKSIYVGLFWLMLGSIPGGHAQVQVQVVKPDEHSREFNVNLGWIEWWEANRDRLITPLLKQSKDKKPQFDAVIAALLKASTNKNVDVRCEAVLSLGRLDAGRDRVAELLNDPERRVRCRACVALGLLQDEKTLLSRQTTDDADLLATVTALGLLDKPSDDVLTTLRKAVVSAKRTEIQRMAIWALQELHCTSTFDDAADNELLLKILRECKSPSVVTEALYAMRVIGRSKNLAVLEDVARLGNATAALPAFADLPNRDWQIRTMRTSACAALSEYKLFDKTATATGASLREGDPLFTAIANTLVHNLSLPLLGKSGELFGAFPTQTYSVFAFSNFGQEGVLPEIVARGLLNHSISAPALKPITLIQSFPVSNYSELPARALAAVAIGISKVPVVGGQETLALHATVLENQSVRCASLLAMGLETDHSLSATVDAVAKSIRPGVRVDQIVQGHVILAFGLIHDLRALQYAAQFGGQGVAEISAEKILETKFDYTVYFNTPLKIPSIGASTGLLSVRAAILGLGVLQDKRAGPLLMANWGQNEWISLEAARAMNWCDCYEGVPGLIALVNQDRAPSVAALAARSLGEVMDPARPPRLSRLCDGVPYWHWVQPTSDWISLAPDAKWIEREFHGLADPYLYWGILPHPGGESTLPWS